MPRAILLPFASLALVGSLTGCLFQRFELNTADFRERVASVEPGVTTQAELEALVGPPGGITPLAGGDRLLVYAFGEQKTAGLTLILLNISRANAGFDTAIFHVDAKGVIREQSITRNSEDLRWQWWAFGD